MSEDDQSPQGDDAGPTNESSTEDASAALPPEFEPPLAERVRRLRRLLVPRQPEYDPSPGRRFYLLAAFVLRRYFIEDRCGSLAASLTLSTLLSTVPGIGVALLVVGLLGSDAGSRVLDQLFTTIFPDTAQAEAVAQSVQDLASNVTVQNLGAWGFGVALIIAFFLFQTLERTFNAIWRSARRRSVIIKFTMFYTLATLGPLIVGFSLAQPFMPDVSSIFGAHVVITGVGFVLLNRFLPYAEVRLSAAIAGGLVTALLFELGKFGFGVYVQQFAFRSYEGVYGPSLAILPVFVVWSQLSWMVVLLGAEVAFVMQHRKSIALLGYMNRYVLDRLAMQRPSGRTAARIMLAIADQYARRSIGQTADALAERFGLGLDTVTEILARLKRAELIAEVDEPRETLVPARPLEQIRVLDVMLLFDRDQARDARDDRLTRVFANFDRTRDRLMGQTTYRDLVDDERPPPQPDEAPEPGDETGVELDPRSGPRAVLPIDRD